MAPEASDLRDYSVGTVGEASSRVLRLKRPERPSREDLNQEIAKINENIGRLRKRADELSDILNDKNQGQNILSFQILDSKKRLAELRLQYSTLLEERKAIKQELAMLDHASEKMRKEAKILQDNLPYVRVEEIEGDIKRIQDRIERTTLTVQEEQRLVKQMTNLKKSRDFVSQYTAKSQKLYTDESYRAELLQRMKDKDESLEKVKKLEDEERKRMDSLKGKSGEQVVNIPALTSERSNIFERIRSLRDSINQLRNDFKLKEQEYLAKEKEWRRNQALERRIRFERREAEWKEREEIRRQKELENFVPPYTEEIILCDQLCSFLQKFVPSEKESASTAKPIQIVNHKGFEGLQQIRKNQTDNDMGSWFAGIGSKAKFKKSRAPSVGKAKEKLPLTIDALGSFQKLGLNPPLTVGDAAGSMAELKAKKEHFLKIQSGNISPENPQVDPPSPLNDAKEVLLEKVNGNSDATSERENTNEVASSSVEDSS